MGDQPVMVRLRRNTTSTPWGFRMQGGNEYGAILFIQKVNLCFILRVSHKYNKLLSKLHVLCFAIKKGYLDHIIHTSVCRVVNYRRLSEIIH